MSPIAGPFRLKWRHAGLQVRTVRRWAESKVSTGFDVRIIAATAHRDLEARVAVERLRVRRSCKSIRREMPWTIVDEWTGAPERYDVAGGNPLWARDRGSPSVSDAQAPRGTCGRTDALEKIVAYRDLGGWATWANSITALIDPRSAVAELDRRYRQSTYLKAANEFLSLRVVSDRDSHAWVGSRAVATAFRRASTGQDALELV